LKEDEHHSVARCTLRKNCAIHCFTCEVRKLYPVVHNFGAHGVNSIVY